MSEKEDGSLEAVRENASYILLSQEIKNVPSAWDVLLGKPEPQPLPERYVVDVDIPRDGVFTICLGHRQIDVRIRDTHVTTKRYDENQIIIKNGKECVDHNGRVVPVRYNKVSPMKPYVRKSKRVQDVV